ncbi:MAG: hypothetical protein K6G03_07380 [Lachnospiraceae bacterium]|nr:hypothetical protein [Lachnospiraceae bacterium]
MSYMREYAPGELDRLKDAWLSDPERNKNVALRDQTWRDMNMDQVLARIDTCASLAGEERLYSMLREPFSDTSEILKRDELIRSFETDERLANDYRKSLKEIGDNIKKPAGVTLKELENIPVQSNTGHIICALLGLISIAMIFVSPTLGLMIFLAVLILNISTYFKRKAEIADHLACFTYLIRSHRAAKAMLLVKDDEEKEYRKQLKASVGILSGVVRGGFLVTGGKGLTGGMINMLLDYLRIFFHLDLIRFNSMQKEVLSDREDILLMLKTIGGIDAFIAVAEYRKGLQEWCVPEYTDSCRLEINGLYHPLLIKAVPSDIVTSDKGVLITGSNASGKSTFLRSVGLAAILGQSIATVTASSYKAPGFIIMSSMSISDDILEGDSYYMAEIKSVKRIIDVCRTDGAKSAILCFVDEVLRGTNTIERIAASSEILKSLHRENVICFAATHDVELTEILKAHYDNYHFSEDIVNDDVAFSYMLKKGAADTRNAIRLLGIMGYDEDIVKRAEEEAGSFEKDGIWQVLK